MVRELSRATEDDGLSDCVVSILVRLLLDSVVTLSRDSEGDKSGHSYLFSGVRARNSIGFDRIFRRINTI
jgi:hypothetical protein